MILEFCSITYSREKYKTTRNALGSSIQNSQKLETPQILINRMEKQTVVYSYYGISEKEETTDACKMVQSHKIWNKEAR